MELPGAAPVGPRWSADAGATHPGFDVAITPSWQACTCVRRIARDLTAAGLGTLPPLE